MAANRFKVAFVPKNPPTLQAELYASGNVEAVFVQLWANDVEDAVAQARLKVGLKSDTWASGACIQETRNG